MERANSQRDDSAGAQAVCRMFDVSICKMHYDLGADSAPWSVACFDGVSFHGIDVFDDQGIGGRKVLRNADDIAADVVDDFLLAIPRSARISLAQNGRVVDCAPGGAILFATSLPFSSAIAATRPGGRYSQLLARVSGAMLRKRLSHIDLLSNHVFDVRSGAGKVLRSLLELGIAEGAAFSRVQSHHFGEMLLDALANALREAQPGPSSAKPSRAQLREMAVAYIERHLSNPALDVAQIAAHCGVSVRYLHAACAETGMRLGAYIRAERMVRAREALRDPTLKRRPLAEIALHWGYGDPAHFSRAYKAHFGIAPSGDRAAA